MTPVEGVEEEDDGGDSSIPPKPCRKSMNVADGDDEVGDELDEPLDDPRPSRG